MPGLSPLSSSPRIIDISDILARISSIPLIRYWLSLNHKIQRNKNIYKTRDAFFPMPEIECCCRKICPKSSCSRRSASSSAKKGTCANLHSQWSNARRTSQAPRDTRALFPYLLSRVSITSVCSQPVFVLGFPQAKPKPFFAGVLGTDTREGGGAVAYCMVGICNPLFFFLPGRHPG